MSKVEQQREQQREQAWHVLEAHETVAQLQTDLHNGLAATEAQQRIQRFGPNELVDRGGVSPWKILWGQLTSIMVVILIVAGVIAAFLGDLEDTIVIMALVIINTLIGFTQEYRAERSMAALKQMAVPVVRVRRDNKVQEIPAPQLVPGDIVLLEAGNRIPYRVPECKCKRLRSRANLSPPPNRRQPLSRQTSPWATAAIWSIWEPRSLRVAPNSS